MVLRRKSLWRGLNYCEEKQKINARARSWKKKEIKKEKDEISKRKEKMWSTNRLWNINGAMNELTGRRQGLEREEEI